MKILSLWMPGCENSIAWEPDNKKRSQHETQKLENITAQEHKITQVIVWIA